MRILTALLLFAACSAAQTNPVKALFTAIRNNDLPAVKSMAAKEGVVNARGDRETTPLIYASAYGSLDAMKLLLDAGADVNLKNAFEANALIWSVNEPKKVKLLFGHNAGVNAELKTGRTPLMIAALHNGSDRVVDLLLAKGANTKAQDDGADVNGKDQTGYTALMNAAMTGDVEFVKLLLSKGAEVNAISGQKKKHPAS